jgi:protein-disulfide isomerase
MREIWFGALVAMTLAAGLPAAAQTPAADAKGAVAGPLAVTPQDRVLGNADAPITIIEFASFTCPHCAHFAADVLPKLKKKWIDTGKARLVLRAFPRDEADLQAAMVTQCAPPEKYYPLVDTLFEMQEKWVVAKDWHAALQSIALLGGISKKDFDACVANKQLEDQVAQSRLTATQQLGVNSTPTFFVNGKKYESDPTVEGFDQLLSGLAEKS